MILGDHRQESAPGQGAWRWSPLVELGIGKAAVRRSPGLGFPPPPMVGQTGPTTCLAPGFLWRSRSRPRALRGSQRPKIGCAAGRARWGRSQGETARIEGPSISSACLVERGAREDRVTASGSLFYGRDLDLEGFWGAAKLNRRPENQPPTQQPQDPGATGWLNHPRACRQAVSTVVRLASTIGRRRPRCPEGAGGSPEALSL